MVGNDIVDLHAVDSPAYHHVAYLMRVCTAEELHAVRSADNPSLTLATLWASKEAAYKSFSRRTSCRFVPKRFAVRSKDLIRLSAVGMTMVTYDGIAANVELTLAEDWVHAVATLPGVQLVRWSVREIEKCCSDGYPAQAESEAARFLAAELISRYCQGEVLLDFDGRTPILTLKTGGRSPINISFSHHGRFAAVTMSWLIGDGWRVPPSTASRENVLPREETCFTCTA